MDDGLSAPRDRRLSWVVIAATVWYVAWTAFSMSRRIPAFRQLFSALGAELPLPTRTVIAACTPAIIWPAAGAVILLLVAVSFKSESVRVRILVAVIIFMATACLTALVTEALFQPMFSLIEKVG